MCPILSMHTLMCPCTHKCVHAHINVSMHTLMCLARSLAAQCLLESLLFPRKQMCGPSPSQNWRPPCKSELIHSAQEEFVNFSSGLWPHSSFWGPGGPQKPSGHIVHLHLRGPPGPQKLLCGHRPLEKVKNSSWGPCGLAHSSREAFCCMCCRIDGMWWMLFVQPLAVQQLLEALLAS